MSELLKFDPLPKRYKLFLFIFLIFLSSFLRLNRISSVPPGLNQDESAIGYNAYSILKTGRDEYGKLLPMSFKSFNDNKLPVYVYLTSTSIKLFGLNEFAVRFPSALSGIGAVIILFFLMRYLTKNDTLSFISAFSLALNPIHIYFSRAGFEVNLAMTLILAGIYFFINGIDRHKISLMFLSLVCFILSLYSYNAIRLLAPLISLALVIIFWKKRQTFSLSFYVSFSIVAVILLIPFLTTFFTSSGIFSASGALITGNDILIKNLAFRSYLDSLPVVYTQLFYNRYIYMVFQYFQNLATIVSGSFFFVVGSSDPIHGVGNVGFFYLYELPFFIAGLTLYFQLKKAELKIFFYWLVISVLVLALSSTVPQATRGYSLVLPTVVFISLGFLAFLSFLSRFEHKKLRNLCIATFIVLVFYNLQYYFISYYLYFPKVNANLWREQDKELALFLKNSDSKYSKIIVDNTTNLIYTSLLFYEGYPPDKFITSATRYKDSDLIKADSWGKYQIRAINWKDDFANQHSLIVTSQGNMPNNSKPIKYIYGSTTYNVFSTNGTIISAPYNEIKYVLIETDSFVNKL